jgi:isoquinoline 1-oxidoreductase beta subunit
VWVPTQSQTSTQQAAMAASGLPEGKVFVHTTYLGGGFGRRGETDFVTDAVETSEGCRQAGQGDLVARRRHAARLLPPITYIRLQAAFDANNNPIAWKERIVQPSLLKRLTGSLDAMGGIDRISVDGRGRSAVRDPEHPRRIHRRPIPACRMGSGGRSATR